MSKYSPSDHQEYLHKLHQKMQTPVEIIKSSVQKATGHRFVSCERLVAGQMHEVYDVTVSDGKSVIVRISHNESPRFDIEKWALDTVRELGVPAPDYLLLETVETDDKPLTICIEPKLPGVPLQDIKDEVKADWKRAEKIACDAGQILSRIHTVKTQGIGKMNQPGQGKSLTAEEYARKRAEKSAPYILENNQDKWIGPDIINRAAQIMQDNQNLLREPFSLLHGDYSPLHLLVDEDRITGVLDMENVSSGDPVMEFAYWDSWGNNLPFSTELLLKNYPGKDSTSDFEAKLHYFRIDIALYTATFYVSQKNFGAAKSQIDKTLDDIKFFS